MPRILHWFRNDLRTLDNPGLLAAATESQGNAIACFCLAEDQWLQHDMAPIKVDFLYRTLKELNTRLTKLGIPFHILQCNNFADMPDKLITLANSQACEAIYFNEEYGVNERRRDRHLKMIADNAGTNVRIFRDQSIIPVGQIRTQQGLPYSVFSPFKCTWWTHLSQTEMMLWPEPRKQDGQPCTKDFKLPPLKLYSYKDSSAYKTGQDEAHQRLDRFVENQGRHYHKQRDIPSIEGTSQLSPYLALGILSGKQCLHAALHQRDTQPSFGEGLDVWINELIWRDFYINILYDFPRISMHRAFKEETDAIVWRDSEADFLAWCQGRTGIPLVDAAMRQLNQTGWMHNRLRMVCAMFLTKNLFIDWRKGEQYFMQNLIDGYLPANNGGWQWSASTGTDAAPYFRIFNPVSQGERFDPDGRFIRTFVPELEQRSNKKIHQPLDGEIAGFDYPTPLVDLKSSRQRAIEAFKSLRH